MPRIAVALGGAWNVWEDFEEAKRIIGVLPYDVAAVNEAGRDYTGHLSYWCSLHPEKMHRWQPHRKGNQDYRCICKQPHKNRGGRIDEVFHERFSGSSGSYIVQVLVLHLKYDRVIVCGVPLTEEGHYFDNDPWRQALQYRKGWREMVEQPEFAGKVRSMSGWTRDMSGAPSSEWLTGDAR